MNVRFLRQLMDETTGNRLYKVADLRQLLLVLPTELVEVADIADRLGPAPREEALDVVPVGLGQDSTVNFWPQSFSYFLD